MALTAKKRNVIIGIAAVLALAAIAAAYWLSCSGDDGKDTTGTAATVPTATARAKTTETAATTATTTAATTATTTSTNAAPGGGTAQSDTPPTQTTQAPSSTFEITERQVNPAFVSPGAPVTFSAWVKGDAASVTMRVNERDSGTLVLTVPLAYELHAGSGIYKWSATVAAPMNTGVHRYFASAVSTGGVATEMPGVSGWTFCVGNVVQDCP